MYAHLEYAAAYRLAISEIASLGGVYPRDDALLPGLVL
jgi:hypothetical protein